ncbi:MAG: acyl-CoA dehydrogenase family protein [Myxococcales bacterium]
MQALRFAHAELPPSCHRVREEIRAFLREHLPERSAAQRALSWTAFDAAFSRKLGGHGFLGMTFPEAYGGRGMSALERYVVIEELLAAGAPVAAHWMADRQSGPLLLRFGSEHLKRTFLPRIARGEAYFCIGMSEPDTGSDLASVRTSAVRVPGGFIVNGTKLWGTHVTRSPHMIALVRTQSGLPQKHAGLSQLLIDLDCPGITVRPVLDLLGHDHFGEVTFEEAFVPEERLIGSAGAGWQQVVAELGLERSGPERILSSFELLRQLATVASEPEQELLLGSLCGRLSVLRQMSLSVAARLSRGEEVGVQAAIVKELGTSFEQALPQAIHDVLGTPAMLEGGDTLMQVHAVISQLAPSYSLRGGTREILRGIIAKELLR